MNRIINEQRFNQHLAATQKRTEVFVDMPREEIPKSILDKQNVQIIKENFSKKEWRKFPIANNIIDAECKVVVIFF